MRDTRYLLLDEVVRLHDAIVKQMNAPYAPLLHADKLESALARPRHASHYEGADLIRQATILAVGISQSQAFEDGNKRAAYLAADAFLRLNGLVFQGDPFELAVQLEAIAEAAQGDARDAEIDRFDAMLRHDITFVASTDDPFP